MLSIKRTIRHVSIKPFYYPKTYFYATLSSTSHTSNDNDNNATKNDNDKSTTTTKTTNMSTLDIEEETLGLLKVNSETSTNQSKVMSVLFPDNQLTYLSATALKVEALKSDKEPIENNNNNKVTGSHSLLETVTKKMEEKTKNQDLVRARRRKAKAARKTNANPLLQRLKHQSRLSHHKNASKIFSPSHLSHILQPKLLKEDKSELDNSWTELQSSKYERVYPDKNIPVATLAHGLERTLFKTGIHPLRDFNSKKLLFSPYLESITQPEQFDYNAIQSYITSSQDKALINIAKKNRSKFVGSTSSISGVLSHIYYQLSNHRPVDISFLSDSFANEPNNYTRGARAPKTIYLRYKSDNVYAIDADKAYDEESILSRLGKSMEKLLTLEPNEYERFLKENSSVITEEEKNAPEAYAYGKFGDMVLRSQLDCYHKNLPKRTFDLKTRATMPVRLDKAHYKDYYKYTLEQHKGKVYSFEREYYDMMRSAFLKYNFQVRIGHMDGIMVTYHNTNKIFGFQYISRQEMDARLFGTTKMGDEAFTNCLEMIQHIFKRATLKYPRKSLRISFDASDLKRDYLRIFVEPLTIEQEKQLDNYNKEDNNDPLDEAFHNEPFDEEKLTLYELKTKSYLNDKLVKGPVAVNQESIKWDLFYQLNESALHQQHIIQSFKKLRKYQSTVFLPQSDESPKFLQLFKLDEKHYHQERRLRIKEREEKEKEEKEKEVNQEPFIESFKK